MTGQKLDGAWTAIKRIAPFGGAALCCLIGVYMGWLSDPAAIGEDKRRAAEQIGSSLESLATAVAFLVGGIWVYSRFIRGREGTPRVNVEIEANFIGAESDRHIAEVVLHLKNVGRVRQEIRHAILHIRSMDTTRIAEGQLVFEDAAHLQLGQGVLPRYIFVEPETTSTFTVCLLFRSRIPTSRSAAS